MIKSIKPDMWIQRRLEREGSLHEIWHVSNVSGEDVHIDFTFGVKKWTGARGDFSHIVFRNRKEEIPKVVAKKYWKEVEKISDRKKKAMIKAVLSGTATRV